jgi:hypothetical protein
MTEFEKLSNWLTMNGYKVKEFHKEMMINGQDYSDHRIEVYNNDGERVWDAICQRGSYGFNKGLLEVMGSYILGHDDVEGWLTADDVIEMLKKAEGNAE